MQELQTEVIEIIDSAGGYILLSDLGFKLKNHPRPKERLKDIVEQLANHSTMTHPTQSAKIYAYHQDHQTKVETLLGVSKNFKSQSVTHLYRSVLSAFCKEVPEGSNIYLSKEKPFKYKIAKSNSNNDYIKIAEYLRIPIENIEEEAKTKEKEILEKIKNWTNSNDLEFEHFFVKKIRKKKSTPSLTPNALSRFLSAQHPNIVSQIVIPGDIAALLLAKN